MLKQNCTNSIYISEETPSLFALLFADDIADCADTVRALQQQIHLLERFCNETGMLVNLEKTKIIVFRNGGPLRDYERWFFNGSKIEVMSYYKYLGLIFTPKLVWSKTKQTLAAQAIKSLMTVFSYQRKFGYFNCTETFKSFDTMVKPVLCYGSEVWGHTYSRVH